MRATVSLADLGILKTNGLEISIAGALPKTKRQRSNRIPEYPQQTDIIHKEERRKLRCENCGFETKSSHMKGISPNDTGSFQMLGQTIFLQESILRSL